MSSKKSVLKIVAVIAVVVVAFVVVSTIYFMHHVDGTYSNPGHSVLITFGDNGSYAKKMPGNGEVDGTYKLNNDILTLTPTPLVDPKLAFLNVPPSSGTVSSDHKTILIDGDTFTKQ